METHLPRTSPSLYTLSEDPSLADNYFELLKDTIFKVFASSHKSHNTNNQKRFFCESGWIDINRRYFYLKPLDQQGWLFERSGFGWVVSRSEKIVLDDLFLRKSDPLDIVTLFLMRGMTRPRVASRLINEEVVSFSHYEELLIKYLAQND